MNVYNSVGMSLSTVPLPGILLLDWHSGPLDIIGMQHAVGYLVQSMRVDGKRLTMPSRLEGIGSLSLEGREIGNGALLARPCRGGDTLHRALKDCLAFGVPNGKRLTKGAVLNDRHLLLSGIHFHLVDADSLIIMLLGKGYYRQEYQ